MEQKKVNSTEWRVGIYCRLSKDDMLSGESASISNQREIMQNHCAAQGWKVYQVYQDDGYTGLNMDRPDLQRMLKDCENGLINMVMTKDQSRLGRNHVQTGYLMEEFFPKNGIRYVALYDNVDTFSGENEILPFKNVLNEMYSKDISKKVHASYHLKAQKGEYTGVVAPLGYLKDPECKNHLIIDEETAPIVRKIFEYAANGHSLNYITRRLEEQEIPCPTWWNRKRGYRNYYTKWEKQDPVNGKYVWDQSALKSFLMNPVYAGCMASQKTEYRFKVGIIREKSPDEWILVEDTHEPIITREQFELVQDKILSRKRTNGNGEYSLFAGLIKCGECGAALTCRLTKAKNPQRIYSCSTYIHLSRRHCSQHRINYDALYDLVLRTIRDCGKAAISGRDDITGKLEEMLRKEKNSERDALNDRIRRNTDRLELTERMVAKLYEDVLSETITEITFKNMLAKTQAEQQELRKQIAEDESYLGQDSKQDEQSRQWRDMIAEYADIKELDSAMLNKLIKKIVIYENQDNRIDVEIHFNFRPLPECGEVVTNYNKHNK
jgi:DNA invertase Pin-like site-specific DNA recombinase